MSEMNPLNDLIDAKPVRSRTGRRELRLEEQQRGITIHHRDRSEREVLRAVAEGRQPQPTGITLPIRRRDRKSADRQARAQGKLSARQQRKARQQSVKGGST